MQEYILHSVIYAEMVFLDLTSKFMPRNFLFYFILFLFFFSLLYWSCTQTLYKIHLICNCWERIAWTSITSNVSLLAHLYSPDITSPYSEKTTFVSDIRLSSVEMSILLPLSQPVFLLFFGVCTLSTFFFFYFYLFSYFFSFSLETQSVTYTRKLSPLRIGLGPRTAHSKLTFLKESEKQKIHKF